MLNEIPINNQMWHHQAGVSINGRNRENNNLMKISGVAIIMLSGCMWHHRLMK